MNEELKIIISAEISNLKSEVTKAKKQISNFVKEGTKDFGKLNDEIQKYGNIAKTSLKAAAGAIVGATTALLGMSAATSEYRQGQAKLNSAFEAAGKTAETAKKTYNDLYRVLGDSDVSVEAANHLAKLSVGQKELAEYTTICQGIYATFGDSLPIEGLTEAVNHTVNLGEVQGTLADALEWSGVSVESFNEQLAACSSESEREKLIRETLNGMYSDAAAKYEENAAQIIAQNEANQKMTDTMAQLGEVVAPINTMLTELGAEILADLIPYIQEFAEKYLPSIKEALSGVGEAIGKVITWIADNWELVSTIATVIGAISVALGVLSTVMGVVNAVMAASPVTWIVLGIVAAIAALVAIIVVVIKHWDEIKAATLKCWEAIKSAVQSAIDWVVGFFNKLITFVKDNWQGLLLLIVNPFAGAFKLAYDNCEGFRTKVNGFVSKIKDLISKGFGFVKEKIVTPIKDAFSNVKNIFSNIVSTIQEKLNSAKSVVSNIINAIKGFFSFKISWPKIPMPHFAIKPSGWKIGDLLKGSIPSLSIDWYAQGGVFDKPTLFYGNGALSGLGENGAEAVVPLENNLEWLNKLADMLNDRMGGSTPVVLNVDGKVFAQTAISTINQQTKQTGKLALNLV